MLILKNEFKLAKVFMEALRIITKPVKGQLVINLPPSLLKDEGNYEVIILPAKSEELLTSKKQRKPSPKLVGKVELLDDLTTPAVSESDWQLS
jgi:hypothetical protein